MIEKLLSGRAWLAVTAGVYHFMLTLMVCKVTVMLVEANTEDATQIVLMLIPILSGLVGGVVGFYFQKVKDKSEKE